MHKEEPIDLAFQEDDRGNVSLTESVIHKACGLLVLFHVASIHVVLAKMFVKSNSLTDVLELLYCVYYT